MGIVHGLCPISRCALETLSKKNWLRKCSLIVQDIHCGCPDCIKRARQIDLNEQRIVKAGEMFE